MYRLRALVTGVAALAVVAAFGLPAGAQPVPSQASTMVSEHAVCGPASPGTARCHAHVVDNGNRFNPRATTSPTGLVPSTIKSVYGFDTSTTAGAGKTIAIVDAYDDPTITNDLATFSSSLNLPVLPTCGAGVTGACFQKVDQTGGTSYPKANSGWALEIALDVEWAHAIAPGAKILLVEASSNSFSNLLAAEDYAKTHADYVSNSWGASEFSGESSYDPHFAQSGVGFFVSAGDNGTPAEYPSSSPNVVSVGGTTLHFDNTGAFTGETGWSSGGGGCSAYENKISAQTTGSVDCKGKRATPDISLDADPNSGVAVYDTTAYYGQTGWFTIGGTSASSPMTAAHAAVAGTTGLPGSVYGLASSAIRDITSGNNGAPCLTGFDLCSGRGSWLGGTTTGTNTAPTASPASATVAPGAQAQISLTATDTQTCPNVFAVATPPSQGSVSIGAVTCNGTTATATATYTANSNASGSDSFTYTASDGTLTSSPATVSITISGSTTSPTMHVSSISYGVTGKGGKNLQITIAVADGNGAALAGVGVTVNVSSTAGYSGNGSGTTGSTGKVVFTIRNAAAGTYSTTVTALQLSGYSWDQAADAPDPGYIKA